MQECITKVLVIMAILLGVCVVTQAESLTSPCTSNSNCLSTAEVAQVWKSNVQNPTGLYPHAVAIALHESCYPNMDLKDCDPKVNNGKCCDPNAASSAGAVGLWQTTCLPAMKNNPDSKVRNYCTSARAQPGTSAQAAAWIIRCACSDYPNCNGKDFCNQWASYPEAITEYEVAGAKACSAAG